MFIRSLYSILFICGITSLQSQILQNVTRYDTQAARFGVDDEGRMVAANLRIDSATTDLDDYVVAKYSKQPGGMNLTAISTEVYPDIGVFDHLNDSLFAKTASATPSMQRSGTTYAADLVHSMTSDGNVPYTMEVTAGLGLSFIITTPTRDFWLVLEDSSGDRSEKLYRAGTSELNAGVTFLKAETVKIFLIPVSGASVTLGLRFGVENRFAASDLTYGSNTTTPAFPALRAYLVKKATLAAGSRLDISTVFGNGAIALRIIHEDSTVAYSFDGLVSGVQLGFVPEKSGDYHVVFMRNNFTNTSSFTLTYNATLVEQAAFVDWQQRFAIEPSKRGMDLDADGDGWSNLEEYALGGDPSDRSRRGLEPSIGRNASSMEFVVNRPLYVTGVSYQLESSPTLQGFVPQPLATRDGFGTDELYFQTNLTAHPRQFYKFSVSSP